MKNTLREALRCKEEFTAGTSAPTESIIQAEQALGLSFAEEYKEYLTAFGNVSFLGHIFTGISQFSGINVVTVTNETRRYIPSIEKSMYVIEETHMDGIVIVQDASGQIFQIAPRTPPLKLFDTLENYVNSL